MSGFLNPEGILQSLGILTPGMQVADLGCGAGYFSVAFAQLVGDTGRVYAVDVLQTALDSVERRAKQMGATNITTVRANLEKVGATGLPDHSVHLALLATVLFQSENKQEMLKEAKRILQKGGFLVIIDWDPQASIGAGSYKISKKDVLDLAAQTGFTLQKEFPVDAYHYGLLFVNS